MTLNELFHQAVEGDRAAEKKLFDTLSVRFRLLVFQRVKDFDDCNDIVQNALLAISKDYRSVQIRTSFAAWAYQILKYRMLNHFRENKNIANESDENAIDANPGKSFDANPILTAKLIDCLRKINKEHSKYARVLNLYHQGYTTEEICDKLGISPNYLYVILSRARSMLKLCLEKGDAK